MWPGDREQHIEILRPFNNVEARMIGMRALRDAKQYWRDGNYKSVFGDDYAYNDRYGASGVRLARLWLESGNTGEVEVIIVIFIDLVVVS